MYYKESSPILSKNKFNNRIYYSNEHEIFYLSDNANSELVFLYTNSNYAFNFKTNIVKVLSDKDYYERKNNNNEAIAHILVNMYEHYDIGGYPLSLNRIEGNLYNLSYGIFDNINKENDINNQYGKKIKANFIFLNNSLKHLFSLFPDIEIIDIVEDFRQKNIIHNINNPQDDFKRRINFFKKNHFLILSYDSNDYIQKSSYYEEIKTYMIKEDRSAYIYLNKIIFESC